MIHLKVGYFYRISNQSTNHMKVKIPLVIWEIKAKTLNTITFDDYRFISEESGIILFSSIPNQSAISLSKAHLHLFDIVPINHVTCLNPNEMTGTIESDITKKIGKLIDDAFEKYNNKNKDLFCDLEPPCTCSNWDLGKIGCTCQYSKWKAKNRKT